MCIKNLPRKINKSKHVLTVINLYFSLKISCSAFLSFPSVVADKYSFHYFFLILIIAGFCVCVLAGSVCFFALHLLLSKSFALIFRELCACTVYMLFAV